MGASWTEHTVAMFLWALLLFCSQNICREDFSWNEGVMVEVPLAEVQADKLILEEQFVKNHQPEK